MGSETITLGLAVPSHTPHALSVSLPTWRDNVGYEEGEKRVVEAMVSGYPRFFIHLSIQKVCPKSLNPPPVQPKPAYLACQDICPKVRHERRRMHALPYPKSFRALPVIHAGPLCPRTLDPPPHLSRGQGEQQDPGSQRSNRRRLYNHCFCEPAYCDLPCACGPHREAVLAALWDGYIKSSG
jgi:hypothetical protein